MFSRFPVSRCRTRGVALVIVLAFVVLLTGLVLAFFSRALSERQISNSSANAVRVDLFAQDAVATTLGDLRQEIAAGSAQPFPNPTPGVYLYNPKAPTAAAPCMAGVTGTAVANLPNLIKRSANNTPFFSGTSYDNNTYPPSNRAASSSSISVSQNGRTISPARWNKGLMLPKQTPDSDTDFTPLTSDFKAPDWIVVARDGTNPTAFDGSKLTANGTNPAIGRYAYNIYNEGGLLDMNAAGYPDVTGMASPLGNEPAYKSSLAFADLTQLPGIATTTTDAAGRTINGLADARQKEIVRTLVGWRNYASAAIDVTKTPPTAGPPISGSVNVSPGYSWTGGSTSGNVFNYLNFLRFTDAGFLNVANRLVVNNQSDRSFASRQQLINLLLNSIANQNSAAERAALQNSLQSLGTFSRSLNQPSYFPISRVYDAQKNPNPRPTILPSYNTTDPTKGGGNNIGDPGNYPAPADQDALSPSFLALRTQAVYKRNDNVTDSIVGEPLVKTRFALQRLAWLTYKGPSANRSPNDADMTALINTYGISKDYLSKGTAENIQRYFGLDWDAQNARWKYDLHNRGGAASGKVPGATGVIRQLKEIADLKTREPDFFELLKASVDPGSIGKASVTSQNADPGSGGALQPLNFQFLRDIAYDAAIMQIGANIIDQFDVDGYPTRIVFDDGSGRASREFRGVENLPYIYRVRTGILRAREPIPEGNAGGRYSSSAANNGCTPELHSGVATGYTQNPLKDAGVGILLGLPDIWNPHDQNSSMGNPRPGLNAGSFRVIATSATPDNIAAGTTYNTYTVGGNVVSATNYGRYKGVSYQVPGNGSGGAVSPSTQTDQPIPIFSRTPTNGAGGVAMTGSNGGYNNPQVISSLPYGTPASPATSSTLRFSVPNASLFREPTLLAKPDTTSGSGLSMDIVNPDVTQLNDKANQNVFRNGGLVTASDTAGTTNPLGQPVTPSPTQPYIGIYLGAFPIRWVGTRWSNSPNTTPTPYWVYTDAYPGVLGGPASGITYSLQCQDEFGNWVSYDEKYVNTNTAWQWVPSGILLDSSTAAYAFSDPRTSHFGSADEANIADANRDQGHYRAPVLATWLDSTTDVFDTERPGIQAGFGCNLRAGGDWGSYTAAGWHYKNVNVGAGANSIFFQSGLFTQNDPSFSSDGLRYAGDTPGLGTMDATFYSDPDGVVRRATGAFVRTATLTIGQPLARASTYNNGQALPIASQSPSRPKILNRPFRSVGELGYVFSGTPWKNLDFSTPESGYSELLDVFCVNETSDANALVAGKVDLNTRQPGVLAAVLANSLVIEPAINAGSSTLLPPDQAAEVATLLVKRTSTGPASGAPNTSGPQPLANVGDLVGKWVSRQTLSGVYTPGLYPSHNIDGSKSYDGFSADLGVKGTTPLGASNQIISPIEAQRETAVRALASVGNTRVWNLLIDMIAQTGRYPGGRTSLDNFVVEGEQRCWMHVAIDRATGQVVDSKLEIVKE